MQGNVGAFFSSTSWLCKCPSVIWQQVDKQPSFVSAETKQLAISEMLSVKQGVGCRVGWGGGRGWRQGIGGWGPGMDFSAFLNKISVGTPPPASTFIYLFLIYFSFLIRSRLSISHETEPKGSAIEGWIHIQAEHKTTVSVSQRLPKIEFGQRSRQSRRSLMFSNICHRPRHFQPL